MPIYRGSQRIAALYKGGTAIGRVYRGSTLVFDTAAGGGGGANYATNENLAEQTTTGTDLTGAEIATTLAANTDYLFLWSQDVQTSATSSAATSDVLIDGASIFSTAPSILPMEVGSPIDYQTMGGIFRYQSGASPAPKTFTTKAKRTNAATLKCRNARLSYLALGPNDAYAESLARQIYSNSTTNKTAQVAATLSFTPPTVGDYTVVASLTVDLTTGSNVAYGMELTDGVTSSGEVICRPPAIGDRCPMMLILPLAAISGSKTISLKVRQTGSGGTTIAVSEVRIVALRNDRFANVRSTALGASSAGNEGSYTTALSQTFTPAAADHLTIACWQMGTNQGSVSAYSQLLDGATVVNEFVREFSVFSYDGGLGAVSHAIGAYPAASRTQAIQRKSEATSGNQVQKSAAIVCFDLSGI